MIYYANIVLFSEEFKMNADTNTEANSILN